MHDRRSGVRAARNRNVHVAGLPKVSWPRRHGVLAVTTLTGALLALAMALMPSAVGAVTNGSVALTSTTAAATQVTYTVEFTPASAMTSGVDTVTLTAPVGTVFAEDDFYLTNLTTTQAGYASVVSGIGTNTAVLRTNTAISGGNDVRIVIKGVTNPAAGATSMSIVTSTDAVPATPAYTITAGPTAVTGVSAAANTTTTAGATKVTYTVGFTPSANGGLAAGQGLITLTAPAGTLLVRDDFYLTNLTTTQEGYASVVSGLGTNTVVLRTNTAINGGNDVRIVIKGVTNPAAGSKTLSVATTSDVTPAVSAPYDITAGPTSIGVPLVTLSSTTAAATQITYTINFSVSATGGLAPGQGEITVDAPAGTAFVRDDFYLTNLTTTQEGYASVVSGLGTNTVVVRTNTLINGGNSVRLAVRGVTNPTVGSKNLTVATTSDVTPHVSGTYTITAGPTAVTALSVSTSTPTAGATKVTYTVQFTASATGALVAGQGQLTLTAPAGTAFVRDDFYLTNLTTSQEGYASVVSGLGTNVVVLRTNTLINGGNAVRIAIKGATNPTEGAKTLTVTTSSDAAAPDPANYTITAGPTSVTGASVTSTPPTPGATGVSYNVFFTASATGTLVQGQGEITLTGPAGTVFGSDSFVLHNLSTLQEGFASVVSGLDTNTVVLRTNTVVNGGNAVRISIDGITNPSPLGDLSIVTTSDQSTVSTPVGDGSLVAPTITSPNATTVTAGVGGTFGVTTTGAPIPVITTSALPTGVTFVDNANRTGTLTVSASAAAGVYPITITASNGETPDATQAFTLTVAEPGTGPAVTGLDPTSGPVAGGNTVTITGTNLTGVTGVSFGATPATGFTFVSDTTVTATAPPGAVGTVGVSVTTPDGTSPDTPADDYTYTEASAAPTITSPDSATFTAGVGGTFGVTTTGTPIPVITTSALPTGVTFVDNANRTGTLTVSASAAVGVYPITITASNGVEFDATQTFTLTVTEPGTGPTITGLVPSTGPTTGGTVVTITGTNLTGVTAVNFGITPATAFAFVSDTTVTATAPPNTVGTIDVTVTTPDGTSPDTTADDYTYTEEPTNTPPVATDQSLTTPVDTPLTITLSATDADSDPLTYTVAGQPANGTLTGTAPDLTYTPDTGFAGTDSFTFTANDGTTDSNTGTITIQVGEQPPVECLTGRTIEFSTKASRSRARILDGATVGRAEGKRSIAIFLAPYWRNIRGDESVVFALDGEVTAEEHHAPYDLLGTRHRGRARLLDVTDLQDGVHVVTVTVSWTDGRPACTLQASFTVDNTRPDDGHGHGHGWWGWDHGGSDHDDWRSGGRMGGSRG